MNYLNSAWGYIVSFFKSPLGQLFAKAGASVVVAVGNESAAILAEMATQAVADAEARGGPGTAKKSDAMNRLAQAATRAGINVGMGLIDTLVQNAWTAQEGV